MISTCIQVGDGLNVTSGKPLLTCKTLHSRLSPISNRNLLHASGLLLPLRCQDVLRERTVRARGADNGVGLHRQIDWICRIPFSPRRFGVACSIVLPPVISVSVLSSRYTRVRPGLSPQFLHSARLATFSQHLSTPSALPSLTTALIRVSGNYVSASRHLSDINPVIYQPLKPRGHIP